MAIPKKTATKCRNSHYKANYSLRGGESEMVTIGKVLDWSTIKKHNKSPNKLSDSILIDGL